MTSLLDQSPAPRTLPSSQEYARRIIHGFPIRICGRNIRIKQYQVCALSIPLNILAAHATLHSGKIILRSKIVLFLGVNFLHRISFPRCYLCLTIIRWPRVREALIQARKITFNKSAHHISGRCCMLSKTRHQSVGVNNRAGVCRAR